jgi:hypothetical protein
MSVSLGGLSLFLGRVTSRVGAGRGKVKPAPGEPGLVSRVSTVSGAPREAPSPSLSGPACLSY